MRYLTTYKLFESVDTKESVIEDIRDILRDVSDEGYIIEIRFENEYINDPASPMLLNIEISSSGYDYIDLPAISDTITRLYDYMKDHQGVYNRNPFTAAISVPSAHKYYRHVGWAQFDKRYEDSYKSLLNMTDSGFRRMLLQWKPKRR